MAKLAELASRAELTPSELKRFGKRVHLFETVCKVGEDWAAAKQRVFKDIEGFMAKNAGKATLYTGIHSESDWTKVCWWAKGAHLVNRTCEFAVIVN